jgi:superfamily I DNA/RNA helicase
MTEFRIADTFTDSLARLTGDEQKLAKTTAFDLQLDPVNPGMQLHRLDRAKDKRFWSLRVGRDVRMIVHRTDGAMLLCYVGHHDDAYRWAERRRLETHPRTGAAQFVEIRELVEEVATLGASGPGEATAPPGTRSTPPPSPATAAPLFAHLDDETLLRYGVPADWMADVRGVGDDGLLDLASHLPAEAAEALMELAIGREPVMPQPAPAGADPFAHPDAQRRFRIVADAGELARALSWPWDKWAVFLHPAQRQWVERTYVGPAKVAGSAGTGKTIVALHRAVWLARRNPEHRVLLATFSPTLAGALAAKLRRLADGEPRLAERLEVADLDAAGMRLYEARFGRLALAEDSLVDQWLSEEAQTAPPGRFGPAFVRAEWHDLVDPWRLDTWESYRDAKRLGRKTRLSEAQRGALWAIYARVYDRLSQAGLLTRAGAFDRLSRDIAARARPPFDHVVIDEAQDLDVPQLRLLAAIGSARADGLFFAGDLGQRIFQTPFSWKSLGVDVRGRSRTLRINYRTSHQIRTQADRLLSPEVADVDGNVEERRGTLSVFEGPAPRLASFADRTAEVEAVAAWLRERVGEGVAPHEIGIVVRDDALLPVAQAAAEQAALSARPLDGEIDTTVGRASLCTMHQAKGLEFRAVAVMACDDEVIPLQSRIDAIVDELDLAEVYDTERHLLYVACTRARDWLLVTCVEPGSEFLEDLLANAKAKAARR